MNNRHRRFAESHDADDLFPVGSYAHTWVEI